MESLPQLHNKPLSKDATSSNPTILKQIYIESVGWAIFVSNEVIFEK